MYIPISTTDHITLRSQQVISDVKFHDQKGVMVWKTQPDASHAINVRELDQGIYFIKINDGPVAKGIVIVR